MSFFSAIGNFFKHLFVSARPEIDKFIQKYEALGIKEVTDLAQVHDGKGLHEWRDEAFVAVKAQIAKDEKDIKDNWVAILVNVAYEHYLAQKPKDPVPVAG